MAVTLINPFEVPAGKEDEAVAFWERVTEYMRRQPGFLSARLHRAVVPGARFPLINVAEWESAEHFQAAIGRPEFATLTAPYRDTFPHYPALYEVIRT